MNNKKLIRRILFLVIYTAYMLVVFAYFGGISTWSLLLLFIGLIGGIGIELFLAKKHESS